MRPSTKLLANERGMILVISLMILALLLGAGVGAIVSMQTDLKSSSNLKTGTQALYLAEAGIERGKKTVKDSTSAPPVTAGSCAADETLGPGSFTVCYPSVSTSGSGAATVYTVTISSTGNVGSSSKTLQSAIRKVFVLSQAAVSFTGNEADSSFSGTAFRVDGNNWDYNSSTSTYQQGGTARLGISVPNTTLKTAVNSALAANQKPNITGTGANTPSLDVDTGFTKSNVSQLADEFCNQALAANKTVVPNSTLSIAEAQTWGTHASPIIRCFQATSGFTPGNPSVDVSGNTTGAGVLVVRDSDLVFRGAFNWEGLIIVTGQKAGFEILGGGSRDIYGSAFVNETDYDPVTYKELVLQDSTNVRYSDSALKMAYNFLPMSVITSTLPSTISTVYWREVTN